MRVDGDVFDAVVVGSGPNGLVAANVLADHGWSVVVLEAVSQPGGAVRSSELLEPGFTTDWCSAFYPLAAASPALATLGLERFGLRWMHAPHVIAHPARDGSCPTVNRSLDLTASMLDHECPGDGERWRSLVDRWRAVEPGMTELLMGPMPPVRGALRTARLVPRSDWVRFVRSVLLPVRQMAVEEGLSDIGSRLLVGLSFHADLAPEATLSGLFGWLLAGLSHSVGFPVPEGGAQSLTDALIARLVSLGGVVRCGAEVASIAVDDGRAAGVRLSDGELVPARRAVLADVSAPALYRRLVAAGDLPAKVLADMDRFQWDNATFKVDWTLDGTVPWAAARARGAGTVHVAESVDEMTTTAAQLACGLVPDHPFVLTGQQSMTDPSRAPAGSETFWAYTHVPRRVRGDVLGAVSGRWDSDDNERFADRIQARIEELAPGFTSIVRRRRITAPPEFELENDNLSQGAINGGTAQLHQQLLFRPVPGTGRPSTPIRGLFLASASAHPGGGVHGVCGSNAARAALAQQRMDALGLRLPSRRGRRPQSSVGPGPSGAVRPSA